MERGGMVPAGAEMSGSHPRQGDHSHRHGKGEVSGAGPPGEGTLAS